MQHGFSAVHFFHDEVILLPVKRLFVKYMCDMYEGVSKSFRTESITKYTLTFGTAR
jgi:hypothetical protein